MILADYINEDIKRKESMREHLENLSFLLREVVSEIEEIANALYVSDEKDIDDID